MNNEKRKPILCLDFDGVCHSYESGWKGADVIPDSPVKGMLKALTQYSERFRLCVFSSRSHQEGGIEAMKAWFARHAPELELEYPKEKPPAMVSLDDRTITFEGEWPNVETLENFKPWNKSDDFLYQKHRVGECLANLMVNFKPDVLDGDEILLDALLKVLTHLRKQPSDFYDSGSSSPRTKLNLP